MAAATPAAVDRTAPPPPRRDPPLPLPAVPAHAGCSNGLDVVAARLTGLPLVSLELILPAGAQYDPPERRGWPPSPPPCSTRGRRAAPRSRSPPCAERLGGYFTTGADWDVGYLAHRPAGEPLPGGARAAGRDRRRHPTFPRTEVERLRRQRIAEILRRAPGPRGPGRRPPPARDLPRHRLRPPALRHRGEPRAARPRRPARLLPRATTASPARR